MNPGKGIEKSALAALILIGASGPMQNVIDIHG